MFRDISIVEVDVDGRMVELVPWDTPSQEDFDRLRPLSYQGAHAVMICYRFTGIFGEC